MGPRGGQEKGPDKKSDRIAWERTEIVASRSVFRLVLFRTGDDGNPSLLILLSLVYLPRRPRNVTLIFRKNLKGPF